MRTAALILFLATTVGAEPLPIDELWKSEAFRKTVTGSFGIDSRIEPNITTDEEFYLAKAAEAMAAEDREAAIAALTESSLLEESPSMLFTLATHQLSADEPGTAIENFRKALALFPNFRDAHRNLAMTLVRQEKHEEAIPHLTRAIELGSREGVTMGLLGYCHQLEGNYRSANEAYRLATLTQPDNRQWIEGLAQTFTALEQPEYAADLYQQLLGENPTETRPWLAQADAFVSLEKVPEAIANLEIARRLGVLTPAGLVSLGHLYLREELYETALARYESAFATEEGVSPAKAVDIVEQLSSLQRWEDSDRIAKLVNLPEEEDENAELLSRLTRARALIELEIGDAATGSNLVEEWLTKHPTDGLAILLLARFRQEEGKREEAEMLLERAARDPAVAAEALLNHGKLLVEAGEFETAIEHLEQAQRIEPKDHVGSYLEAVRELADGR